MCRPGQIASFPLNSAISKNGLVVAMDFYPYSAGAPTQTIFSIRNTATNFVSLRCDYFLSSGTLNIWINPASGAPFYVFNSIMASSIAIKSGKYKPLCSIILLDIMLLSRISLSTYQFPLENWNRVVVEIVQTQPAELGAGSVARIWVNQTVTPQVYFGNFAIGKTVITDGNNAALEICGVFDLTGPNMVSAALTGYFDVLNFVWLQGLTTVFQNLTSNLNTQEIKYYILIIIGRDCTLQIFPKTRSNCLQCANGLFLQDSSDCVATPSNDSYFLHTPTNSYQSNSLSFIIYLQIIL